MLLLLKQQKACYILKYLNMHVLVARPVMVQCNPWENPVYFDGCCTHTEKIKFLLWHRVFVYTMEEVRMILYYGLHPDVRRDPKKLLNIS